MFRKENGVTLVALVITIIVLLILAGVTISMVLGEDGIISQASGANQAQNLANVKDQVTVAYATIRTEQIARKAGVSTSSHKATNATNIQDYTKAIATELAVSKAFDHVYYKSGEVVVEAKGTKGQEFFKIVVPNVTGDSPVTAPSDITYLASFDNNDNAYTIADNYNKATTY